MAPHLRVEDPVHFRPDPDPANQNLKTGPDPTGTHQESIQISYLIFSDTSTEFEC